MLLGAHEAEIRRYLVEHGYNSDIKFAYCRKGQQLKVMKICNLVATQTLPLLYLNDFFTNLQYPTLINTCRGEGEISKKLCPEPGYEAKKTCITAKISIGVLEMVVNIVMNIQPLFYFAEPTENLADVPDDQIVETIETSDGPVASTVEHVHEIAKDVSKSLSLSLPPSLPLSLLLFFSPSLTPMSLCLKINYSVHLSTSLFFLGVSLCSLPACRGFDSSRGRLTDPNSFTAQPQARVQDQAAPYWTIWPSGK